MERLAGLAHRVPLCARSVLVVGTCDDAFGLSLRKRGAVEVYTLTDCPAVCAAFDSVLAILPRWERDALPFPARYFDAIVLVPGERYPTYVHEWMATLSSLLTPNGYVVIEAANAGYWRGCEYGVDIDSIQRGMQSAGLQLYGSYRIVNEDGPPAEEDGEYLLLDGRRICAPDEISRLTLLTPMFHLVGTALDYNPLNHAGALSGAGRHDEAGEILSQIPAPFYENDDVAIHIHLNILLCQFALYSNTMSQTSRLQRLMAAQWAFYRAIARCPHLHFAYRAQAELWYRFGNADMAVRLLRSIEHVAPDKEVAEQLTRYGTPESVVPVTDTPPTWVMPDRMPRVLFITHPRPHFGLDILFDGLRTVLGDENVTEYPWKPSLHGCPPSEMADYPCVFDRPGTRMVLNDVLAMLSEGVFDAVVFGDIERSLQRSTARQIAQGAQGIPIFLLDQEDTCEDPREMLADYLDTTSFAGLFKREMLMGVDYGPNAFPLPFAYPDGRVPGIFPDARRFDLFWAGSRGYGLRRLYLERLEQLTGRSFQLAFSQEDYVKVMQASRVGLNIFGAGFDTVRFWELPAHGCLLLSERLPIRIPYGFRDGETALFFDDTRELEEKLAYCIAHRDSAAVIARAGHEHFMRYHTGSARARQALAWMRQCGAFERCYTRNA